MRKYFILYCQNSVQLYSCTSENLFQIPETETTLLITKNLHTLIKVPNYQKLFSDKSTFFCFTPLVSLATFFIEILLALFVLYRYGFNKFSRIAILILVLLGVFQLTEYMMCVGGNAQLWSKIGTSAIAILPVSALHLTTMLTRKSVWTEIGYILGFLIVGAIFFLEVPILPQCTGNFVELKFSTTFDILFNLYYALFLFIALEMIIRTWRSHKGNNSQLFWALMIYTSFLVPTALVYIFITVSRSGIPSIMCGFAVIGAIILVFKELPLIFAKKSGKKKK